MKFKFLYEVSTKTGAGSFHDQVSGKRTRTEPNQSKSSPICKTIQFNLNLFLTIPTKVNPVQYAKQRKFERPISVGSAWQFHLLDVL